MSRYDIMLASFAMKGSGPSGYTFVILKDQNTRVPFRDMHYEFPKGSQYSMVGLALVAAFKEIMEAGDATEVHVYTGWLHYIRVINTKCEKYLSNGWCSCTGEVLKNVELQQEIYSYLLKMNVVAHPTKHETYVGKEWSDHCKRQIFINIMDYDILLKKQKEEEKNKC